MTEETKPKQKQQSNLFVGVVLIGLGLVFLGHNFYGFHIDNWWALFILIPAFMAYSDAWKMYQQNNQQFTKQVKSRIIGGSFPLLIALIFLLNLDWSEVWPLFIILAGIAMMFG